MVRIATLLIAAFASTLAWTGPVDVAGVVTFARRPDPYFFMQTDAGEVWRIQGPREIIHVAAGDRVSVRGDVIEASYSQRIKAASVDVVGHAQEDIPRPARLGISELVRDPVADPTASNRYARLVEVEGVVRDVNRRQTFLQIIVGDSESSVLAVVPHRLEKQLPEDLKIGAKVRVTGLYVYTIVKDPYTRETTSMENPTVMTADSESLVILSRAPFWTPAKFLGLIAALVAAAVVVVFWVRSRERARADAVRRERLRLSHDLHDGFQQLLAGSMFRLEAAMNYLPEGADQAREQLEKVSDSLYHTQTGLRAALWSMTEESEGPQALSGLVKYAAGRLAHWAGKVHFTFSGEERRVSHKFSGELLMILQEAVGNALRHGAASDVRVRFSFRADALVVTVRDNGCGFDAASIDSGVGHLGLRSMRSRVRSLDGSLSLTSEPGHGTIVVVRIPYGARKK